MTLEDLIRMAELEGFDVTNGKASIGNAEEILKKIKRGKSMTQFAIIEALADDIHKVIQEYGDSMPFATVIGVLETIKMELYLAAQDEDDEPWKN